MKVSWWKRVWFGGRWWGGVDGVLAEEVGMVRREVDGTRGCFRFFGCCCKLYYYSTRGTIEAAGVRVRRHRLGYGNPNYHALIFRFVSDGTVVVVHFFLHVEGRGPERFKVNRLMVNRFAVVRVLFFRLIALLGVKAKLIVS